MKMRMSLGLWVALVACLGGVAYQLMAIERVEEEDWETGSSGWSGEFNGKRGVAMAVVKSSRPREVTERKSYFDFERLEGSALSQRFFRANPGMKEMVEERRELDGQVRALRAQGLGRRHPDVVALRTKIEPLEEALVSRWKSFQAQRSRERERR